MARQKRNGWTLSLTAQEKARVDRLLEITARQGRQQVMLMVDAELQKLDPAFLNENKSMGVEVVQETPPEIVTITPDLAFSEGWDCGMDLGEPEDNPYEPKTPDYKEWERGYCAGDSEVTDYMQMGYDARNKGYNRECPWKPASREEKYWLKGYDKAESSGLPE